jgi:hypothetical protein
LRMAIADHDPAAGGVAPEQQQGSPIGQVTV